MQVVAYLRVSTDKQTNGKFKSTVSAFCKFKDLPRPRWVEETVSGKVSWRDRLLGDVIFNLVESDVLIFPSLSRIGRSTVDILDAINTAKDKGVTIYLLKENLTVDNSSMGNFLITIFSAIAQLERDLISERTKEALKYVKEKGVKLGRPEGRYPSRLDPYEDAIKAEWRVGYTERELAEKYGCSKTAMHKWLKKAV